MTSSTATSSGIMFGPTQKGKWYISVYKHRGSGSPIHKSCWLHSVAPQVEFTIFVWSDDGDWRCSGGHYWGLRTQDGSEIEPLGNKGERLCKFPRTANSTDPWHGYPVLTSEDAPPDEFVEQWLHNRVITRTVARRIQKGRL